MEVDIRDRLKELRETLNLSQSELGAKISLERSTISLIERKQRNLTDRTLNDICREFNVDFIWLTTGEGEMFVQGDDEIEDMIEDILNGENEFHKNLFKTIAKLSKEELDALENVINAYNEIAEENKKS